jgi:RNA polymerase II subunit A small phosphatase-like protein
MYKFSGIQNESNYNNSYFNNTVDEGNNRKVLVLDLDETLIHSSFSKDSSYDFEFKIGNNYSVYTKKRPGLDSFLKNVMNYFDVYIFTASIPEYCHNIISRIMPGFNESKILTRDNCRYLNGNFIKELSLFGKDLSWDGDQTDNKLNSEVLPLLEKCYYADDVRTVINQSKSRRRRAFL